MQGAANFTGDNSFARIVAGTSTTQQAFRSQVGTLSQTTLNFGNISPAIAQNLANPQVQQWNLGVQREILGGVIVKGQLRGNEGQLPSADSPDQPDRQPGGSCDERGG